MQYSLPLGSQFLRCLFHIIEFSYLGNTLIQFCFVHFWIFISLRCLVYRTFHTVSYSSCGLILPAKAEKCFTYLQKKNLIIPLANCYSFNTRNLHFTLQCTNIVQMPYSSRFGRACTKKMFPKLAFTS